MVDDTSSRTKDDYNPVLGLLRHMLIHVLYIPRCYHSDTVVPSLLTTKYYLLSCP